MLGQSIRRNRKNLNNPFKIYATIALVAIGMIGVTAKISDTFFRSSQNQEEISELNLIKQGKVIISRYLVIDPTTGEAISVSQIKNWQSQRITFYLTVWNSRICDATFEITLTLTYIPSFPSRLINLSTLNRSFSPFITLLILGCVSPKNSAASF